MGCGGLLGVNAGSAEAPRMIKLTYRPSGIGGHHLTLVGKGIMYDAGGIALKPADEVHATMKNDMSGAGAILASMLTSRSSTAPTRWSATSCAPTTARRGRRWPWATCSESGAGSRSR
jgi:leucyl aminopeptidase